MYIYIYIYSAGSRGLGAAPAARILAPRAAEGDRNWTFEDWNYLSELSGIVYFDIWNYYVQIEYIEGDLYWWLLFNISFVVYVLIIVIIIVIIMYEGSPGDAFSPMDKYVYMIICMYV